MMCRSEFQLSIDPSIANTGVVLWRNGDVVKHHTIKTPASCDLAVRIKLLTDGVKVFVGSRTLTEVAVEGFQGHRVSHMLKMMKCSMAQGALVAVAFELCDNVTLINKRNEPKGVARDAAIHYGLRGFDEHVADAFRLGQLAGFNHDD